MGLNKLTNKKICPVCAGVALTWVGMLTLKFFFGYTIDKTLLAMLMGGSAVGISYYLDSYVPIRYYLPWRFLSVVPGFVAVYSLLAENWIVFIVFLTVWLTSLWFFVLKNKKSDSGSDGGKVAELEKEFDKCC